MKSKIFMTFLTSVLMLASCSTPKDIVYFQDMSKPDSQTTVASPQTILLRPQDKITIIINSKDKTLAEMFNLKNTSGTGGGQNQLSYTIDKDGFIDMPVIGKISVNGLSRNEVAEKIKEELITKEFIKDPVVIVEFSNLGISVLGEVQSPGRINIDRDQFTIIDAIRMAGDLTINGRRENVRVLRNENGYKRTYVIDLTSGAEVFNSPAYYLQQNDEIYVEPNNPKIRMSTTNGNTAFTPTFWISMVSFAITLSAIFLR